MSSDSPGSGGLYRSDRSPLGRTPPSVAARHASASARLAALRAEIHRARGELLLGHRAAADAALARLRPVLMEFHELDKLSREAGPEVMLVRASALTILGRLQERTGRADDDYLRQAAELFRRYWDPEQLEAAEVYLIDRAIALAHAGDLEPATQLLERLPQGPERADLLFEVGMALAARGSLSDARDRFEDAAALNPTDPTILQELARGRAELGDGLGALRAYREAAGALARQGRDEELADLVDRALTVPAQDARALALQAELLGMAGRGRERLHLLNEAAQREPDALEVVADLALAMLDEAGPHAAREVLERAAGQGPSPSLELARATVLLELDDEEAALAAAQLAVDLAPEDPWARFKLAQAAAFAGDAELTERALDEAVALDPSMWLAHSARAAVLRDRGALDASLEAAQAALSIAPESAIVRREMGETLRRLGRASEAAEHLRRAVELAPDDAWAATMLGQALDGAGAVEEAIAQLRAALDLDPNMPSARLALVSSLFGAGRILEALDEINARFQVLEDTEETRIERARLLARRGEGLRMLDRSDMAREALEHSLDLEPRDPYASGTLGQVLLAEDRPREAVRPLEIALEEDPSLRWALRPFAMAVRAVAGLQAALAALAERQAAGMDRTVVLNVGVDLIDWNRAREELAAVEAVLEGRPDWDVGWLLRGYLLDELGSEDAPQALQAVAAAAPGWPPAVAAWASLRVDGPDSAAVEAEIDRALAELPFDYRLVAVKAKLLRLRGASAELEHLLRRTLREHGEIVWAREELFNLLRERDELDEAVAHIRRAVELDPTTERYVRLAQTLNDIGRAQEAASVTMEALDSGREDARLRFEHALALYLAGQLDEALDVLHDGLRRFADDPSMLNLAAGTQVELGNPLAALELYVRLEDVYPEHPRLPLGITRALADIGEYAPLVAYVDGFVSEPRDSELLGLRAWALQNLAEHERALACYRALLADDEHDLWARKGEMNALFGLRLPDEARATGERIVRELEHLDNLSLMDRLSIEGWTRYRLGDHERAIDCFERTLSLDGKQVWAQFDLALALLCGEMFGRAYQEYLRGIEVARRRGDVAGSLLFIALRDLREATATSPLITERVSGLGLEDELSQQEAEVRAQIRNRLRRLGGRFAEPASGRFQLLTPGESSQLADVPAYPDTAG
jgi:tetratricopeptide (TPR) repeat protein